jgi:hypothetical protein
MSAPSTGHFSLSRAARDPNESREAKSLPEGAVVVDGFRGDKVSAAREFRRALEQAKHGNRQVESDRGLSILTAGPLLCEEDHLELGRFERHGSLITLEVLRTHHHPPWEKPPPWETWWRPLIAVPLLLSTGSYELRVTWRNRDDVAANEPLSSGQLVCSSSFIVPKGCRLSKSVRGAGVELRAVVDGVCHIPRAGGKDRPNLGLLLSNRSGRDLSLFDIFPLRLRSLDGHPLERQWFGLGGNPRKNEVSVAAGSSHLFLLPLCLRWSAGHLGGRLILDGAGLGYWYYEGIPAGRYAASFEYLAPNTPVDMVRRPEPIVTNEIDFEIVSE